MENFIFYEKKNKLGQSVYICGEKKFTKFDPKNFSLDFSDYYNITVMDDL